MVGTSSARGRQRPQVPAWGHYQQSEDLSEISGLILEALKICPHVESLDLEFLSVLHFSFSFLTF